MNVKQKLYQVLYKNKGKYLSGEELAGMLGVSRNAVWKAMGALRGEGHRINAVTKRGYCLETPAKQVNESEICSLLDERGIITSVEVREEADSTNKIAKEEAIAGVKEGALYVARSQKAGRGRMGRKFFSPYGGIYMSVVLRPRINAERAVLITTCAAVAVARAIEKVTGVQAGIKWVNDIFVNGKKVCGILTEAGMDFESNMPEYVVLGIGINVEHQSVPEELREIVGCLEDETKRQISKNELIAAVWNEFSLLYESLGNSQYMEEYKERSVLLGKEVTVLCAQGNYSALVKDIDGEGHLVILHNGRTEKLSSGEVSVRL